ncbi:MAG: adenylate/guanylate cyclase domain-containing protein [Phycisphaerales bacterium]|jgi:class 3 adenylate cyclase|nr:adenylate/guanylate cyclase domain-containing protein [Phycisphaerales bacterium]
MRIRTVLLILLAVQLVLVAALISLAVAMQQTQMLAEAAVIRRYESYRLADELRQSSDDLTRFARTYVATGDPRFEAHFRRVLDIRNGEVPRPLGYEGVYWDLVAADLGGEWPDGEAYSLRHRMLDAGFTNEEFGKLTESQNRSDTLIRLEDVAMNAVKGRFDDGTGTFSVEGESDPQRALSLLHGDSYHEAKAGIMEPIGEFMRLIDERTAAEVASLNTRERWLAWIEILIATILLLTTAISVLLIRSRVLRPVEQLAQVAQRITDGDRSARANLSGGGELATLGATFDDMVEAVDQSLVDAEAATARIATQAESLEREQQRSEKLLLNVLPAAIADRLKQGEDSIAESYPEVTVLFSDIVGFTEMSGRIGAKQVVDMLNEVFGMLDELAAKHGLEKIKTIGDCYMVVAGVPDRSPTHAQQIADFALDMQEILAAYAERSGRPLAMRTGVHTGTVVAGIVGTSKFAYDLWGDVVNVASRMESSSEPGHIQVSDAVRVRLADDYTFEPRGDIDIKGKGSIHTWFLTGRRHEA